MSILRYFVIVVLIITTNISIIVSSAYGKTIKILVPSNEEKIVNIMEIEDDYEYLNHEKNKSGKYVVLDLEKLREDINYKQEKIFEYKKSTKLNTISIEDEIFLKNATKKYVCNEAIQEPGGWQIIFGNFTSKRQKEAIVYINGCQPHVNQFSEFLIFRKYETGWKKISHILRDIGDSCFILKNKNLLDEFVCSYSSYTTGIQISSISHIKFKETGGRVKPIENVLIYGTDQSAGLFDTYSAVNILSYSIKNLDETYLKLTVNVQVYVGYSNQFEESQENKIYFIKAQTAPEEYTLEFIYDGNNFETPKTTKEYLKIINSYNQDVDKLEENKKKVNYLKILTNQLYKKILEKNVKFKEEEISFKVKINNNGEIKLFDIEKYSKGTQKLISELLNNINVLPLPYNDIYVNFYISKNSEDSFFY